MTFPSLESGVSRPSSGIASPPQKMRSRTQSLSSDKPSTVGHSLMSPPLSVTPEAAFIAASAASQIVTNDHDSHADAWYDQHGIEPSGETALVSPAALQLVNNFLDQLLFNFLSISRSTKLVSLRPAVSEVLKPKLAKDAINQADEELREYLGGGDDEDFMPSQSPGSARDWDLELVWKRTRLRCMVYSSLGDMEEEDEDYYMEQEHLDSGLDDCHSDVVSPAVAIFLTSILEFMGEQALIVAGQAAYHRLRVKYEKELKDGGRGPTDVAERIVVEELDMERVALDRTLGRLWRAWKKKIRSPGLSIDHQTQRPFSRDSGRGAIANHLRQTSLSAEPAVPPTVQEPGLAAEPTDQGASEAFSEEYLRAAAIPLPLGEKDVDEIEVPGLASNSDDEDERPADDYLPPRPKSLMIIPIWNSTELPTPTMSQPHTPVTSRKRSNSLPTPAASPFMSPSNHTRVEGVATKLDDHTREFNGTAAVEEGICETGASALRAQKPAHGLASPEPVTTDKHNIEQRKLASDGPPPAVMAGVAAAAHTRMSTNAGLGPAARGSESETEQEQSDIEETDEIEDFTEEPQILTSSRVSIGGRSSPTASSASERSKPLPIKTHIGRSSSVHSLRLIEVQSPRSPVTRSRGSSVDASDHGTGSRSGNLSRANSVSTPPIVEEKASPVDPVGIQRGLTASLLPRPSRISASESISEAEEISESVSPITPAGDPAQRSVSGPSDADKLERLESEIQSSHPIFGSAVRSSSPPRSPPRPVTKVTIISQPSSSGTFFVDDRHEGPQKSNPYAHVPTLPERSAHRQTNGSSPGVAASSIGVVSVDRSVGHRDSSEQPLPRSSDQTTSGPRQLHTSGSSTSSGTNRLKVVRTSEDNVPSRAENVARNFEELIHSDQTIQYTLTPESMRDIDSQSTRSQQNSSPIISVRARKSEDARHDGNRSRSSSDNRPADLKRAPSVSRTISRSSHPVNELPVVVKPPGPIPRSIPAVPPKSRVNGPQARDARLPKESLADFAEFIRSTGPTVDQASFQGRASASAAVRSVSGPTPVPKASIESGRVSTTSNPNRARLQARDAAVDYRDDNSDLIDFIRRGPPSTSGNHRIPRSVAPFRSTMDSDQMAGAVGGKAVDATLPDIRNSQASTNVTDMSSIQSSINSQSALLGRNRQSPTQNISRVDEDVMMPKRKTRRVRDPYAIDLSDEEDEDELEQPTPKRVQTQEESLIDFLRNVPPPPEPTVVPLHIQQAQNRPKKKASAPSLMARFGRRDSGAHAASKAAEARSLNSRAGSTNGRGYIPIQVNVAVGGGSGGGVGDKHNQSFSGATSSSGGGLPRSQGRVLMKKFEPRDAASVPTRGTSDLADFLRNSEPPPNFVPPYPATAVHEDPSGFARLLARRKKSSVA